MASSEQRRLIRISAAAAGLQSLVGEAEKVVRLECCASPAVLLLLPCLSLGADAEVIVRF